MIKDYEIGRKADFFKRKTGSFKLIKLLKCPDLNHDLHFQKHYKITFVVIIETDGYTFCGVFSKIKKHACQQFISFDRLSN